MSETSQAAGRIAVLTAFSLFFAVAWRSDSQVASRPISPLVANKRGNGCAAGADCSGCIAQGAAREDHSSPARHGATRDAGMLAQRAARGTGAVSPFSGRPALLGRSALPREEGDDFVTTAAAGDESSPQ